MFIYKIFTEEEHNLFISHGSTLGSNIDKEHGFIHLSVRSQLLDTIKKHYFYQKKLYISSFFISSFKSNLKWELSRNKEFFPHYYGSLSKKDLVYTYLLEN